MSKEESKPLALISPAEGGLENAPAKKPDPAAPVSANSVRLDLPANFAHDLNNFIAIINGYSEVSLEYLENGSKDEKLKKYLNAIHHATQQAADFTRQLLDLSRPKKAVPTRVFKDFPRGKESVLVIDDEAVLRDMLNTVLGQHGYRVTLAGTGEQATKLFAASPKSFDLVLLDLQLPDISGLVILHRIRQMRPTQKVVTVSGRIDAETTAALERLGVRDQLRKPYHLNELGHMLRAVIARVA
jgi:CheY-like chemotaxis protein